MRARLESVLNDIWYGSRPPGLVLRTLEKLYRPFSHAAWKRELRLRAGDLETEPVVVVGNITAGGAGKTPLVIRLCELLSNAGLRPGVVSRGYGRQARDQLLVKDRHSAREVGDEPLLIHRRCGVPVMVGSNRVTAVRELLRAGVDIVISDDGLQRLRLPRALEICVVDGARGFGNGRLLPAGPLREAVSRIDSVDYVVCNGTPGSLTALRGSVVMHLAPGTPSSLDSGATMDMEQLVLRSQAAPVNAVAGIGNPERFFNLLDELGVKALQHRFSDHYRYTARDFAGMADSLVLMTEKDAVKCAGLGLPDAWYLPVDARLPRAWEDEFINRAKEIAASRSGKP